MFHYTGWDPCLRLARRNIETKYKHFKQFEGEINQLGEDLLVAKQKYSTLKDAEDKIFRDQFNTTAAEKTVTEDSEDEYRDS